MNRLKDKVVVITGANAGVGAAMAKIFAAEGAKLILSARRVEPLEAVAKIIQDAGGEVLAVPSDISKPEDTVKIMKAAVDTYGKLDVLINNAGVLDKNLNSIAQMEPDDLDKLIAINEKGTISCISEALKVMASGASIVNVASVAGLFGCGGAAYVATKAAILGITKHTAMRYAKEQIRCNAICPGSIKTSMAAGLTPDTMDMAMMGAMRSHADLTVPICDPEDVANIALFLASDESRAVTGQILVSDFGADL